MTSKHSVVYATAEESPWKPPPFPLQHVVLTTYLEEVNAMHDLLFIMIDAHRNRETQGNDTYILCCYGVCYYQTSIPSYEEDFTVLDLAVTQDSQEIGKVLATTPEAKAIQERAQWLVDMRGGRAIKILCESIEWERHFQQPVSPRLDSES